MIYYEEKAFTITTQSQILTRSNGLYSLPLNAKFTIYILFVTA